MLHSFIQYVIAHCLDVPQLFIYSTVTGLLGQFWLYDKAAMNILSLVHVFLVDRHSFLLDIYLGIGLLDHMLSFGRC